MKHASLLRTVQSALITALLLLFPLPSFNPICPHGGYDLMYFVCTLGVISMVYGAFAALAQKDFKRMVAYSSVSHMGYVVLGHGV